MKGRAISITIPQPCQEDWNAMTPVQQGKYCNACQKTVTDFTQMSDGQILDIVKRAKNDMPCGRYVSTQLNRPLVDTRPRHTFAGTIAKRAAAMLLLLQSATVAMAQQARRDTAISPQRKKEILPPLPQIDVKGVAIDSSSNNPLAFAKVYIHEADAHVITDAKGEFTFSIADTVRLVRATVNVLQPRSAYNDSSYSAYEQTAVINKIGETPTITILVPMLYTRLLESPITCTSGWGIAPEPPKNWLNGIYASVVSYYTIKKPAATPHLPPMPTRPSTSLFGRLTNYWMGKKSN